MFPFDEEMNKGKGRSLFMPGMNQVLWLAGTPLTDKITQDVANAIREAAGRGDLERRLKLRAKKPSARKTAAKKNKDSSKKGAGSKKAAGPKKEVGSKKVAGSKKKKKTTAAAAAAAEDGSGYLDIGTEEEHTEGFGF